MVGHESKGGSGARYGKRNVPDLAANTKLLPRFKVPALNQPPAPHRRLRRTAAQIAADEAVKAEIRARRPAAQVRIKLECWERQNSLIGGSG
jgi:hypothetical protein